MTGNKRLRKQQTKESRIIRYDLVFFCPLPWLVLRYPGRVKGTENDRTSKHQAEAASTQKQRDGRQSVPDADEQSSHPRRVVFVGREMEKEAKK